MAGIGDDIKAVIEELGTLVCIYRTPSNIYEKITYDIVESGSSEFSREFLINGSFSNVTNIVIGDVLNFNGTDYLVISKVPDMFEGEVVEYVSMLYKCNIPDSSALLSYVQSTNQTTFVVTQGWSVKNSSLRGLLYSDSRGKIKNTDVSSGKEITYVLQGFIPSHYNAIIGDRVYISSSEYYRIQDIDFHKIPGVSVLELVEDDRVVYTP